jgi:uncharacterized membrane protein
MKTFTTKKLVLTALMMALTTVATMFIRINLPLGYVNLGDVFVFLSVFILGPVLGTIAGGVGSAIADLIGFITYAPGTLIIKCAMALVSYFIYNVVLRAINNSLIAQIIGSIVGAIIMALGYLLYEILFFTTFAVALYNLPWNLLQGAVGVAVSTIILKILRTTKVLEKLQK